MTRMVRWGVMGTASIAVRRVIPAIRESASGLLAAVASRRRARAEEVAAETGSPMHHGSYQELLENSQVDAVYIPLPNPLHVPWAMRALEAGKHVLCEKPLALDAEGARLLAAEARRYPQLKVMEAFMYRFHPRWVATHEMLRRGDLGDLGTVHTHFAYHNIDPDDIRNRLETGGGALLDIGCYGVSVARWLYGREPVRVLGAVEVDPRFGVDRLASAVLDFAPGTATLTCATQLPWHQHVTLAGSLARVEIDRPFNPIPRGETVLRIIRGEAVEERRFAPADQYAVMVERFNQAVLEDAPVPVPLDDAVGNMIVLDAIRTPA